MEVLMLKIAIIIGSTRPNRIGKGVADWVFKEAQKRSDAEFELVDLIDFKLPLLDEPVSAAMSDQYTQNHTKIWSKKMASFESSLFRISDQ